MRLDRKRSLSVTRFPGVLQARDNTRVCEGKLSLSILPLSRWLTLRERERERGWEPQYVYMYKCVSFEKRGLPYLVYGISIRMVLNILCLLPILSSCLTVYWQILSIQSIVCMLRNHREYNAECCGISCEIRDDRDNNVYMQTVDCIWPCSVRYCYYLKLIWSFLTILEFNSHELTLTVLIHNNIEAGHIMNSMWGCPKPSEEYINSCSRDMENT